MGILIAFAPFIVFAVVSNLVGSTAGLAAGALVSAALLVRDLVKTKSSPKILEAGTFVLFGGMAIYSVATASQWSIIGVRLGVDSGLFLIVLLSILLRRPFTLQYARERVRPELWNSPIFIRASYVITAAWASAFAIMVGADAMMYFDHDTPLWVGIAATVAALLGAIRFTAWYPARVRAAAAKRVPG